MSWRAGCSRTCAASRHANASAAGRSARNAISRNRIARGVSSVAFDAASAPPERRGRLDQRGCEVAARLLQTLCGGEVSASSRVSETYLLELEREAFMTLCAEVKTQQRMEHILKTGKPLRN